MFSCVAWSVQYISVDVFVQSLSVIFEYSHRSYVVMQEYLCFARTMEIRNAKASSVKKFYMVFKYTFANILVSAKQK